MIVENFFLLFSFPLPGKEYRKEGTKKKKERQELHLSNNNKKKNVNSWLTRSPWVSTHPYFEDTK